LQHWGWALEVRDAHFLRAWAFQLAASPRSRAKGEAQQTKTIGDASPIRPETWFFRAERRPEPGRAACLRRSRAT